MSAALLEGNVLIVLFKSCLRHGPWVAGWVQPSDADLLAGAVHQARSLGLLQGRLVTLNRRLNGPAMKGGREARWWITDGASEQPHRTPDR